MTYKVHIIGNKFYVDELEAPFYRYEGFSKDVLSRTLTPTSSDFGFDKLNNWSNTKTLNFSELDLTGADYTDLATFNTWLEDNTGKSSPQASGQTGGAILRWLATTETGANVVIPQDTPTIIPLSAQPFNEFNIDSKLSLDLVNNWVYFTGVSDNAWITVRATYQGITGDADMTPSIRFYNDKTNLSVFDEVHGQTSKQKNTKTSSYLAEGFKGGAEVMQIYLETDKDETVSFKSLSIKIEDVTS